MTIQEKKDYLSQYIQASRKIDSLIYEKISVEDLVYKVSPTLSDVPKGGAGQDKIQCGVEKMIELGQKIAAEVEDLIRQREKVSDAIRTVEDVKQREVLRLRYINGFTWEKIAVEMNLTYQWVCALHGRALQKINFPN